MVSVSPIRAPGTRAASCRSAASVPAGAGHLVPGAGPQDSAAAWDDAPALPAARIDDGSSCAYLLAWIAAHRTG